MYAEVLFGNEPNIRAGSGVDKYTFMEVYSEYNFKLNDTIGLRLAGKTKQNGQAYNEEGDKVATESEFIVMPQISFNLGDMGSTFIKAEIQAFNNTTLRL